MPIARIADKVLFFIHIPKCGGSSIEHVLRQNGSLALYSRTDNTHFKCSAQHIHAKIHEVIIPEDFYDTCFAVLRQPEARMVSEYMFQKHRQVLMAEKTGRAVKELPIFPQWVRNTFEQYKSDPYMLDNHIRAQTEFLRSGAKLFYLEDGLEDVYKWLRSVCSVPIAVPQVRALKSAGRKPGVLPETRRLIEEFYRTDIELIRRRPAFYVSASHVVEPPPG